MAVETYTPDTVELRMTKDAVLHFKDQLAGRAESAVRLTVKKSGCSGFMYEIDFVDVASENDRTYQFDDITLHVSDQALPVVKGTEIDYITQGINSSVQFKNPNAKAMCGCGESFTL